MARPDLRLADVYGIGRDVPENYVARDDIDGELLGSLTQDKHIVLYGSSKQGKTCLRKWNLQEHEYVALTCSNRWDLAQLHAAILKAAGYSIEQSTAKTVKGTNKITARLSAKLRALAIDATGEAGGEHTREKQEVVTTAPLELDPADVNDIILALNSAEFNRYIVLEDFHYLSEEAQTDFAIALKAFHEASSYTFIVVGVWLDRNRLIQYNGDLTGRVIAINADQWTSEQLREVIAQGEGLLKIEFDASFKDQLIEACLDSVWVVQDACHRVCEAAGVHFGQEQLTPVGSDVDVNDVVREVVDTQSARYNSFITDFAAGFQATELRMYSWLLLPVLLRDPDDLESGGLSYSTITRTINEHHPDAPINAANLTQALNRTSSLQARLGLKPTILDYNQSKRRLDVVDRSFLIWLKHQELTDLLDLAGLPNRIERPTTLS